MLVLPSGPGRRLDLKRRESIWSYLVLSIGCHLVFLALWPARVPQAPAPTERIVQVRLHENRGATQVPARPGAQERSRRQMPPARELPKAPPQEPAPISDLDDGPRKAQVSERKAVQTEAVDQRPREEGGAPVSREELAAVRPAGSPAPRVSLETGGAPPPAPESCPQGALFLVEEELPPRGEAEGPSGTAVGALSWPARAPGEDKAAVGAIEEEPSLPVGPPAKEVPAASALEPVPQAPAEGEERPVLFGEREPVPAGRAALPPAPAEAEPAPKVAAGKGSLGEELAPRQVAREEKPGLPEVQVVGAPLPTRPVPLPESMPALPREAPALAREPLVPGRPPSGEPAPPIGGVQEGPLPGETVRRVPPVYPMAARKLGLEGVVRLSVRIDGEGRPVDVKLAESSGRWDFDASAMEAVAKWRFAPGKEWIEVTIEFKLTD